MTTSKTATKRLTVNAAFLKDIKDDNRQLKELLEQIKPLASHRQTAVNHFRELVDLLAELRDQLAIHFALEEAYGYFEEAIDTAPQLSAVAECLRGEHSKLFERIRDLADLAPDVSTESDAQLSKLLEGYEQFCKSFDQHEDAELKLILNAMDDDIGVGD